MTYQASCHCGAVRLEIETEAPFTEAIECNCSHCSKKGFLLAFVPAERTKALSGEDAQTEYRFNKKAIAHRFCSTCGVSVSAESAGPDGTLTRAINLRTIEDLDPDTLTIKKVSGKDY